MSSSISLDDMLAASMADPEFRAACERNAVADAVSVWLVGFRAAQGLSQRELAARLGMKQAAVARLETGDVEPRVSTLLRIASALGVDLRVELAAATTAVSVCEAG